MVQTALDLTPSLDEVRAAVGRTNAVPISHEILADLDTPVSAYLKIRGNGPSFLLESVAGGERIGRYSYLGSGPCDVVRVKDGLLRGQDGVVPCPDPLDAIRRILDRYGPQDRPPARFAGALGYLGYEAARSFERLPVPRHDPLDLPDAAFMDVDTFLVFDHVRHKINVVSHAWLDRPAEIAYREAADQIEALVAKLAASPVYAPPAASSTGSMTSNVTRDRYEEMVRQGIERIRAGDILQVVLSQRLAVPIDGEAFGLYRRLRTVSPSPYMYFLDFGDHQLVGASPELLLEVQDRVVTARPIAGTRPRGKTPAEDQALAVELLADEKERAEHLMLVDLARNDVGRVSKPGTVTVDQFMTVERFSHVMHLVSDVSGTLAHDRMALDALKAAFPAGTVSGAPKIRAMEIIADLEPDRRGPYAGAVGFVNPAGDMEMAITIRTGVVKDGVLYVQAGAGIVSDSIPAREYVETMNKARAMLEAAGANDDSSAR